MKQAIKKAADLLGVSISRKQRPAPNTPQQRERKPAKPVRINIGGGDYYYGTGWHNIEFVTDGYADKYETLESNIDIHHDLTTLKPFPIEENTLVAAYTSHVIEHLKDEHVSFMFKNVYRLLKPGGYFRISCPDMDLYLRAFFDKDMDFFHYRDKHPHYSRWGINDSLVGMFLDVFATGETTKKYTYEEVHKILTEKELPEALDFFSNQKPYDPKLSHHHVNWWNKEKIGRMLREAGFTNIYASSPGQSFCPEMRDLRLFDNGDPKISLFVECKK